MTFAFVVSAALMVIVGFALLTPPRRCAWCGAVPHGHDLVRHFNEAHATDLMPGSTGLIREASSTGPREWTPLLRPKTKYLPSSDSGGLLWGDSWNP